MNKKKTSIFICFGLFFLISVLSLCFLLPQLNKDKKEPIDVYGEYVETSAIYSTGVYGMYWDVEGKLPGVPIFEETYTSFLIKKTLLSIGYGETNFTISSASDLKLYADITNYYYKVQDGQLHMPPPLVGLPGYTIPTYYKEYPYNMALNVKLGVGAHLIAWTGLEYIGNNTRLYGTFVYLAEEYDYSTNPYRCELKLTQNITISRSEFSRFRSFAGIFDGDGYTITLTGDDRTSMSTSGADGCIFRTIESGGIVKNTKFVNLKAYFADSAGDCNNSAFVGGIVGLNSGMLESCIVENCEFYSDKYRSRAHCAPLAGKNQGTVQNCMLLGKYRIGADGANFLSNWDGLTSFYFVVTKDVGGKTSSGFTNAVNCIYLMSAEKFWDNKHCEDYIRYPNDDGNSLGTNNYDNCSTAHSSMSSSIASKDGGKSGTPWYKYATLSHGYGGTPYYNSGGTIYYYCVYLRVFIKNWVTMTIKSENKAFGTVSRSNLVVPNETGYTTGSWSGDILTIYGNTIKAEANKSAGYEFDYWGVSGRTWTAYFKMKSLLIWFNAGENTTQQALEGECVVGDKYSVKFNTTITIAFEGFSKGGYKYVIISFTDEGGHLRKMKYTAKTGFYIYKYTICDVNKTGETSYAVVANGDIDVSATLKLYQIEFK